MDPCKNEISISLSLLEVAKKENQMWICTKSNGWLWCMLQSKAAALVRSNPTLHHSTHNSCTNECERCIHIHFLLIFDEYEITDHLHTTPVSHHLLTSEMCDSY